MEDTRVDFTMTFRQLSEISEDKLKDLNIPKVLDTSLLRKKNEFSSFKTMYCESGIGIG